MIGSLIARAVGALSLAAMSAVPVIYAAHAIASATPALSTVTAH